MNEKIIKEALKFYNIKDKYYCYNCVVCLENLEKNQKLKAKVLKIKDKMLEDDEYLKSLWNYQDLAENTLLQKKIKAHLLSGKTFHLGIGLLKK